MNVFFVTELIGLKVKSDLGRGMKIENSTFITNNIKKIKTEFTQDFKNIIGGIEFHSLLESDMIIYSKEPIPEGLAPNHFLVSKLYKIGLFFSSLWMLKDNCVNNELGFLSYQINGVSTASSNFIAIINSTARGKTRLETTITKSELKKVIHFFRSNVKIGNVYDLPTTQLIKGHNRISRAFYIIQTARAQSDIALKVSNYCTALESLFATSSNELTHKLSERVAFFLEDDGPSRILTYNLTKKAYTVRSKVVHGDVIKNSFLEELKQVSQTCDELLRRSLTYLIENETLNKLFGSSNNDIDDFFINLILGDREISQYRSSSKTKIMET